MPEPRQYYRPDEVAQMLRVSKRTVLRWIQQGRLVGVRVGGCIRIRRDDFFRFSPDSLPTE